MSTIVTRAGKGSPLTHNEVDANFNNLNNDKYQSGSSPSFAGTTLSSGNLTFSSTGQRITGDMSNATIANRLMFQNSITNASSSIQVIPNGTSSAAGFIAYASSSDPGNTSTFQTRVALDNNECALYSNRTGTGTYLPMTFYTGGSERMRLDTSGLLGIGTSSPSSFESANGSSNLVVGSGSGAEGITIYSGNATNNYGAINFADGTTGDATYRGIVGYRQDLDAMLLYTAATERMRIDSSGNVGIGTASPGTRLTVSSATNAGISVTDGTVTTIMYNSTGGVASIGTTSNHSVNLLTNNTTRVTFDSSGNVGIGGTATAFAKVHVLGTLPSSSNASQGFRMTGEIPSTSTTSARSYFSFPSTQAASFTLNDLYHFDAFQGTFGASSVVTNQYGFYVGSSLTGATNNYGFYSNIASGSNRWNFYAAGTAQNYFAGRVGVGTTTLNVGFEVASAATEDNRSLRVAFDTTYYYEIRNLGAGGNRLRSNNGEMLFNITGTDYARLTTAGEFITGGTTDQGAYNLQCNGTGVWGAGAYVNGSDARLKDNIQSLDSGLDVVKAMRPVTFQYKPDYSKDRNVQPGFIAQELQTAMAGKAYLEGVVQEGTNHLNVAYQNIIPILVKAIQELTAELEALKAK